MLGDRNNEYREKGKEKEIGTEGWKQGMRETRRDRKAIIS